MSSDATSGAAFRGELDRLGISRAAMARLCGVDWGTVHYWCLEPAERAGAKVPQYAWTIVEKLREIRRLELRVAALEARLGREAAD